jgi:hypothetical protein
MKLVDQMPDESFRESNKEQKPGSTRGSVTDENAGTVFGEPKKPIISVPELK